MAAINRTTRPERATSKNDDIDTLPNLFDIDTPEPPQPDWPLLMEQLEMALYCLEENCALPPYEGARLLAGALQGEEYYCEMFDDLVPEVAA